VKECFELLNALANSHSIGACGMQITTDRHMLELLKTLEYSI